jgi:hypothetical protein
MQDETATRIDKNKGQDRLNAAHTSVDSPILTLKKGLERKAH